MAHQFGVAVVGVERTSPAVEPDQLGLQALQLGDAVPDLLGAPVDEVGDVCAGRLAEVTQRHDLADLAEREPDGPGGTNECQPTTASS